MFCILLEGSTKQDKEVESCEAGDLYKGQIFLKGKDIATTHRVPYCILSAKYGLVWPTTVIETYDEKFKKPYKGPWPPADVYGFTLGGKNYFHNRPDTFMPLVRPQQIGYMLQDLTILQRNPQKALELLKSHPLHGKLPA